MIISLNNNKNKDSRLQRSTIEKQMINDSNNNFLISPKLF